MSFPYRLHSLIGPNGAGKTTFFNLLTGLLRAMPAASCSTAATSPACRCTGASASGLSRSFQILSVFRTLTAFENVRVAVQAQDRRALHLWRDAYAMDDVNARTWSLLDAVGLADRAAEPCANLSHGEQRLLEIAISLATDARLLLLDEPLAGLAEADREVVGTLIRQLAATHAVLLIEHDIDRVLALSDRITVLHQGRVIADGKPAEVANDPDVITAYLGAERIIAPPPPTDAESHCSRRAQADPADRASARRLRRQRGAGGHRPDRARGRGGGVARPQRRRQDHDAARHHRHGTRAAPAASLLDGAEITNAPSYEINQRGISLVPEGRRLFPNLTALDNLRIAARPGGASLDEVFTLFPKLRILQRSKAESLSGGERQMLAIARALMVPARVDPARRAVRRAGARCRQGSDGRAGAAARPRRMVIVEHHAETVLPIVDRAYVLVNGRVAYEGSAKALEADPALQARLLGVVQQEL